MPDIIKILTHNIHKGFSVNNRQWVIPELKQALSHTQSDLLCLQEVQGKHKKQHLKKLSEPEGPQTEFLAGQQWSHCIYGKNAVYGDAHHGNSLLSRFPIQHWENINVALSSRASRSILHAVIDIYGQDVHVMCLHLGLLKAEREVQLDKLSERIAQSVGEEAPLIIAGDFNDWQRQANKVLEDELNLREAYHTFHGEHAKTYPSSRPTLRIDRIYYRGFGLRKARVLNGAPWKNLSDHFPLYAELVITD